MYNTQFYPVYNAQSNVEKINNQIADLERLKSQITNIQQPSPSINQTFQIASNNTATNIKYVASYDDVLNELVFEETAFFKKDFSMMWLKNVKNEIRVFELCEIVKKDEKDEMIENLQLQIEQLKKEIMKNESNNIFTNESIKNEESSNVSKSRTSKK